MNNGGRYVNPYTDFGFKKLFGSEPNKDLLIAFLNQLLPSHHQIKDLTYTTTEKLGLTVLDRSAVFDLYCISRSGERFIVEMQQAKQNYFKDRTVYYSSFPIQEQAVRGEEWNFNLSAVYLVGILDFVFAEDKDDREVLHTVQLKDQRNRVFYDKLTFLYLEMPKFTKTEAELKTPFDKWLYVIKHLSKLQERPAKLQERVFTKLFKIAEVEKLTREERMQYEKSLMAYWDYKNTIDTAISEAEAKGQARGKAEGHNEAMASVARQLLAEGKTPAYIAKLTGLTQKEIATLRQ
ncbi:MAG: PD-(D/E)XK nuclease family transposase [Acidobacteria bacterium]|nr:PD-(D/E)XK nuclease family transposase [Acidobacteriota bacterium]